MYTIKLLKQNFVNLVISSFERPEGFKIESIDKVITPEEIQKEKDRKNKFPPIISKKTNETFPPTKEALNKSKKERTNLSNDKLKNISNREFLAISSARRLENITKNNIKSEKVSDGTEKNLEFSFTFDGKFNKELYLKTTAGQVLPKEVSVVEKDGMTYERKNLSGEFFTSGNKRLIIKEGTQINIKKIRATEEIKKIEKDNNKEVSKFKGSPDYKTGFDDITLEAIKRGVNPKFALLAFSEKVKGISILEKDKKRQVLIEEMFTEYDRKKGKIDSALKNKQEAIQISILKEFGGNWKEKAKEYGIKEEVVEGTNSGNGEVNLDEISNKVGIENNNGKLSFIPRLQNTRNVAEDLNNPANLTAGGSGDKYAIGKYKSSNGHTFLVFRNITYGYKAMAADIEAKQNGFSKVISKNASLSKFLEVWTGNWQGNMNKRKNYISIIKRELGGEISLYDKFSKINSLKLARALAKAEGFKGGNNLYKNYDA